MPKYVTKHTEEKTPGSVLADETNRLTNSSESKYKNNKNSYDQ